MARGLTRVVVIVAPRVGRSTSARWSRPFSPALRGASLGTAVGGGVLGAAGALRVRRADPIVTLRGKLLPLHLARRLQTPPSEVETRVGAS